MLYIFPVVISYLIGAVPVGLIVSRLFGIGDIRNVGSGNIGATNVWRVAGFKAAIWVFIGDIGKGVLAVLIARYYVSNWGLPPVSNELYYVICALAAILGHVFPVYLGFKGGKGVNTALGGMVVILPIETLIAFVVFVIVLLVFRYVSLGSISAAIGLFLTLFLEKYVLETGVADVYVYISVILALLIVLTHRQNISRLITGTENRFSFSSKTKKVVSNG